MADRRHHLGAAAAAMALIVAGCTATSSGPTDGSGDAAATAGPDATSARDTDADGTAGAAPEQPVAPGPDDFPPAPASPEGPLDDEVADVLGRATDAHFEGGVPREVLDEIAATGDARLGWWLSDLMRFAGSPGDVAVLARAFRDLTGVDVLASDVSSTWVTLTDHMIAWDLPAWPGYRALKGDVFIRTEPAWAPFFDDADATIDWRLLSWGGVLIDDRPRGDDQPCPQGCIPALDDPALVPADEGDWYPDDATVFGIELAGDAVALPRNVMQVHEMVNMDLGGRRLGIPYCTLCNSAQAWLLDDVPGVDGELVLRTSGLLSRSNKVMYELDSRSVVDTFTGVARSGPLREAGIELDQVSVVVSSWGAWKQAHPDTTIVAQDGGIGRAYPADPLGGRDDDGPIFPVGPVDPRLGVHTDVVGAVTADGTPVAFPTQEAVAALQAGERVGVEGLTAVLDGDGLRVVDDDGEEVVAHQSFWFAWSQFWPTTQVWSPDGP